ncbi:MAG TPA: carboxylesterase family protein [Bryobacteraceae bacterium]|nr:carboxylesterase family protein [Bryobacteraceae bacterium]
MMTRRDVLQGGAAAVGISSMPAVVFGDSEKDTTAKTTAGKIRGKVENGIYVYRGVPYGLDTAKTRFAAPKPAETWDGVRDCFEWGPRTIQPYTAPAPPRPAASAQARPARPRTTYRMPPDLGKESEDCLHLNVWTPALRDGGKRPVMVYFHGGGYTYGTVNSVLYDGNRLTHRGDVVVVTVNGRLNAFGFLYLAELGGAGYEDSGMAGMLDLALSLRWIHDNIAEFGGDSSRVLIFGQSGGGGKCSTLMAMPPAKGLVHRVVCMSGQLIAGTPKERATERARAVLKELNLQPGKIDAIRTMPVDQVKQAARAAGGYGPVTDGRSLPHDPFWPEPAPVSVDVPLILGNTHDETRFLGGVPGVDLFALDWDGIAPALKASGAFLREFNPEEMVAKYRAWHPDYAPRDVYFQITTDTRVWRAEQVAAEKRAGNPQTQKRTWVYQMDWASPVAEGRYKAPHTMDLPFAFDNVAIAPGMVGDTPELQARAQKMADAVSESYIAFAKTGNPNNSHVPQWPNFDLSRRPTMIFDDKVRVENDPRGEERKYIEQKPYAPNAG